MNKLLLTSSLMLVCNFAQADYNDNQRQIDERNEYVQRERMIQLQQRQNSIMQNEFNEQHQQMLNDEQQRGGINPMIPLMIQPPRFCGPYGCY